MLVVGSRLNDTPVLSLQTGSKLASTYLPVIDPANLVVAAYILQGPLLTEQPTLLRTSDIREYGSIGMIIDSADELIGVDDVIKIKKLYDNNFTLVGMSVIDDSGNKLGKVQDYTIETKTFVIQQLQVKQGMLKGLLDTGRLVHRTQIKEINNSAIVVSSPTIKSAEPIMQAVRNEFVNPFRKPAQPEPETSQTN